MAFASLFERAVAEVFVALRRFFDRGICRFSPAFRHCLRPQAAKLSMAAGGGAVAML
jgi:hypothetical protein